VSTEGGEWPVAGVNVVAHLVVPKGAAANDGDDSGDLEVGRAQSDADGNFRIEADDEEPGVRAWACVLQHCDSFHFRLSYFDQDGVLLSQSKPRSFREGAPVLVELPEANFTPSPEDWAELTRRLMAAQTARLDRVARELMTLAPEGVFADWAVARRLGMLGRIEQALLDPEDRFARAGVRLRFSRLGEERSIRDLREQIERSEHPELEAMVETTLERARMFGGVAEVASLINPKKLELGDVIGGIHDFFRPGFDDHLELFPWRRSPLIGYRDYLRDRWIKNQRFQHQLGRRSPLELASVATMLRRLNNRFHQDFATTSTAMEPATRILATIVKKILVAPTGNGYGFGIAAAVIDPQGQRTHGEYLDYLISLTGVSAGELGKRYRLNLARSDVEQTNLVQQNIDTLQRFFTDSHQSVEDPFAVKPDRAAGRDEPLISVVPLEGAGPFFLQYEEWLERDAPFYPENHYDPRATYVWEVGPGKREAVWAKSKPLVEYLAVKKPGGVPGGPDHGTVKWQWVRNHLELYELITAAHADAKALNYAAAEEKYATAKAWTGELRQLMARDRNTKGNYEQWNYSPAAEAKLQKKADVSTIDKLAQFEKTYTIRFTHSRTGADDIELGGADIAIAWWGEQPDVFPTRIAYGARLAYLLDYLYFRLLPACLSEVQLSLGKNADAVRELSGREGIYRTAVRWLPGPANFNVFAAKKDAKSLEGADSGRFSHYIDGPLPYASTSDRTDMPPANPESSVPTNRAELGYFKLKLGNAALEWADVLYRSNQRQNIMRARELYKGVIFLHGEDPEITPQWDRHVPLAPVVPWLISSGNPAVVGQVNRGRVGLTQIDAGLNFYGLSPQHVPPVRFRVLKDAADRFAAGARGAQSDFLDYMRQLDQLTVSEMTARAMVEKASAATSIAQEQQKIADFSVGEAQKQVDAINAQIAAKRAEIAKKDSFFEQALDFGKGMADSVGKLGEMAFAGEGVAEPASAGSLSTGDILKLGYKVGTASNVLGGGANALAGAGGVAGPFGAFLYAGVTSMSTLADAAGKRAAELAHLQNVALPQAKALVELKKRDVTIAQLSQTIARADWQLGKDLLTHYAQRLLNRSFLVAMAEFSNRLMRRYVDLAGRTGWMAERALGFEQDRELAIIGFDYFPRNLRGVTGAETLQLHLAELEATRIQGLIQTIPVKQTISLARQFPVEFGQLKKTGRCRFATSEAPLRLAHPGVYGYRIRNITIAATYAEPIQPHRGLFSTQGVSIVSRSESGSDHILVRYPDALPLSEFRMRDDMWVFDLPGETLLPFEGSGFESIWELMLSTVGNPSGLESMTDFLITFDMRASYSAMLKDQHVAALPARANRSLLVSARTGNAAALAEFRKQGGPLHLTYDLAKLAQNAHETQRKILNLMLVAVGVDDTPFTATLSATQPATVQPITFENGIALSNSGALADGNGGVPLPLNAFVGLDVDQTLTLTIDPAASPGSNLQPLYEVLLLLEYEATF
jgi:hypothetical protein